MFAPPSKDLAVLSNLDQASPIDDLKKHLSINWDKNDSPVSEFLAFRSV